jgi:hypothetical protein
MDWIAIVSAGVCGAAGGAIGALVGRLFKNNAVRSAAAVICFVAAAQLGRMFVTPWVEVEYVFATQPEIKQLTAIAPAHVDELKALMRDAYRKGGTAEDYQRAGYVWGRKYNTSIILLMTSRNAALALRSFATYMDVLKLVYAHDPVKCFDWMEGVGAPTEAELGLEGAGHVRLQQLTDNAQLLSRPEDAPIRNQKLSDDLAVALVNKVRANWDGKRIDFADTAKPKSDLPNDRKAAVCYTTYAMFSEVQAMPEDRRLVYLRGMFGSL